MRLIYLLVFIFILASCSQNKREKFEVSLEKEWKLISINGKKNLLPENRYFIVFHKNETYDIYSKLNEVKIYSESDNIYIQKWGFINDSAFTFAAYPNLKLISINESELIFMYEKMKYEFRVIRSSASSSQKVKT